MFPRSGYPGQLNRWCEAETVTYVGDPHIGSGAVDAAREAWQHALDIVDELGHPDAAAVRDTLRALDPLALRAVAH